VNIVESFKRYLGRNGNTLSKRITLIVIKQLLEGSKTTSELHYKILEELKQPIRISYVRKTLRKLEKRGVIKSESLLFTKSLLWSLNLSRKEIEELQRLLEKTSSPHSS
jgi:hypothetical protein